MALLFLYALGVYVLTLPPTVVGGDSGEIVVAAWTLAVPHPPGYPLITLLGYVFSHLLFPFGEPAYRMGVMNALFGAGAVAALQLAVREVTGSICAGTFAAALYGFSPLVWQYATTPEVFALNSLFTALILLLTARFHTAAGIARKRSLARQGVLTCALALSNQHTIALLVLPTALWVLVSLGGVFSSADFRREIVVWAGLGVVGLAPYPLLALLSARFGDVIYSWGACPHPHGALPFHF